MGNLGGAFEDRSGMDIGADSAGDRALRSQRDSAEAANLLQKQMYDQQRADLSPWKDAGVRAVGQMEDADYMRDFTMDDFQADPGYQFRMSEGMKAINNAASARGMGNSGATMKSLLKYGQDFASGEYNNVYNRFNADRDRRFNRLQTMSGSGQNAAAGMGAASQTYANNVGSNIIGMGNAEASKYINQANRMNQAMDRSEDMVMKGAGMMFSDERTKENIVPLSKEDLKELKSTVKAVYFKYKDKVFGSGDWVGVIAQDLEKTKFGKSVVSEDENGFKKIDTNKVVSILLASLAGAA